MIIQRLTTDEKLGAIVTSRSQFQEYLTFMSHEDSQRPTLTPSFCCFSS